MINKRLQTSSRPQKNANAIFVMLFCANALPTTLFSCPNIAWIALPKKNNTNVFEYMNAVAYSTTIYSLRTALVGYWLLLALSACTDHNPAQNITNSNPKPINADTSAIFPRTEQMAAISKGQYMALYGKKEAVAVNDFWIDVYPVTNADFLAFVKANPQWRRSNVKKIFADGNYLHTWQNDTTLATTQLPNAPVTNVSWFAANAFAQTIGKRLPTIDEWEYVAMADETTKDARIKKSYNQYILSWYETPKTYDNAIGQTYKNVWGVYDTHGLVWEWTNDFNSLLMGGENRNTAAGDNNLFCGGGSLGANDLMNYAAFMRYAFRGSLKANYCVQNLGFRCVKDKSNTP